MLASSAVPPTRVRLLVDEPAAAERDYVLYWMTSARRTHASFALQRAVEWANATRKPLVVLEALRDDYRWRADRFDRFVTDGMHDNASRFAGAGVRYVASVGAGKGALAALARRACVVIADDSPAFFFPRMLAAAPAAARVTVRFEAIDGNGVVPLRDAPRAFSMAFHYRRWLGPRLRDYLADAPESDPLASLARLPAPDLARETERFASVLPPHSGRGGAESAQATLGAFTDALDRYPDDRNHPDRAGTSGLSPYLHFGQLGAHEIVDAIGAPFTLGGEDARSAFLTQVLVWRELGFNFCAHRKDYDRWESLPNWARATLAKHAKDPRKRIPFARLEAAESGDPLWDAAQRQLVRDGVIHNYLRMLWGKRLIEWAPTPQRALEWAIELNNTYALDGRDPNSYSGIFWCFGRYDRPWPESPVFGQVRRMTSASAMKKLKVKEYLQRYGAAPTSGQGERFQ